MIERVAIPVGDGAIEPDFAAAAEMQNLLEPRIIGIAGAIHVAPGGGAHVAAFAGQPGPAALRRRDHAVEGAERVEHAVVAIEPPHRAILGDVERDRSAVAGAVEHGDGDGLAIIGERRGRKRKPGMIVVVRHADQRHALGEAELPAENFRRAGHLIETAARRIRRPAWCAAVSGFAAVPPAPSAPASPPASGNPSVVSHAVDIGDVASDAAQRRHGGVDRASRIFRGVLVAGEALFLVVDDQARTMRLRHLDQRDA